VNLYDDLRYRNLPVLRTHPSRLYVLARLAGLDPTPVEACRVLELGVSEGANLLGMAVGLPGARFIGIDLAKEPVARGLRAAEALGLSNVALRSMDLLDVDSSFGEFDYILVHGIYGWTPPAVGEKVLEIAEQCLSRNGLAFVSYNTMPAGHIRKMVRDMMLFHAGRFENPAERLDQARAFLRLLAAGKPQPEALDQAAASYATLLLQHSDSALFHDDLAPVYEPVYFHEFAARAAAHGLQYAGDASGFNAPRNLRPEVLEGALTMAGGDRVAQQQYLDFLRMRGFRQSLLCRGEASLAAEWDAARIVGCYAATSAVQADDGAFVIADSENVRMTAEHPVPVEYMRRLIAARPCRELVTPKDADVAMALFKTGALELHGTPGIARPAGDRPCASPLVRYQAAQGDATVTTLWHRALEVEGDESRRMLTLLDGTHDRDAVCAAMHCTREILDSEIWQLGRHALLLA
jgi:predicted O-methyltransferase YrrM